VSKRLKIILVVIISIMIICAGFICYVFKYGFSEMGYIFGYALKITQMSIFREMISRGENIEAINELEVFITCIKNVENDQYYPTCEKGYSFDDCKSFYQLDSDTKTRVIDGLIYTCYIPENKTSEDDLGFEIKQCTTHEGMRYLSFSLLSIAYAQEGNCEKSDYYRELADEEYHKKWFDGAVEDEDERRKVEVLARDSANYFLDFPFECSSCRICEMYNSGWSPLNRVTNPKKLWGDEEKR